MIRDIVKIGDERLLQRSQEIEAHEFNTQGLLNLIIDMQDTMHHLNGVGIAAVQIGVHKRIALIEYAVDNPRYQDTGNCPLTVVINPEIEIVGLEANTMDEGCLSVPGDRGAITRAKKLKYKYYDETGKLITGERSDFFTRVLQHEIDHMNGMLFPMRMQKF